MFIGRLSPWSGGLEGLLDKRPRTGTGRGERNAAAALAALDRSLAVIEFDPDGTILYANDNFLKVTGYTLAEIQDRHHAMFVTEADRGSPDYRGFWDALARGEFRSGEFNRIGKGGREIWIEASYNPIVDRDGRVTRVVKYASDVTRRKMEYAELLGQVQAIRKSQAVIEFDLDGMILDANRNFLEAMGYTLEEIRGRHHSMFVPPDQRDDAEYAAFWARLRRGEFQAGQYKRIGKDGREVWIEASYNPVADLNGRPVKVVKYAADVTRQARLLNDLKILIDRNFGDVDRAVATLDQQTRSAAAAADETIHSVETMAAGADQMAASIREISENMARSRQATDDAVDRTVTADRSTARLNDAAKEMTGIVELIQRIAGQINLLALNATIEAARAGEAGRGFAVVATEVKNLANQAAGATADISREIGSIQAVAVEVVESLSGIRTAVDLVREHVTGAAGAIEEQSVVTRDMSTSMQAAALSVATVTAGIAAFAGAVEEVSQAVGQTKEAARVLAR